MEKIGTGLSMLRLAPSKSGLYSPPTPTMTVQVPDTGGRTGNSKAGAGSVTSGSAVATAGTSVSAIKAMHGRSWWFCRGLLARRNGYPADLTQTATSIGMSSACPRE